MKKLALALAVIGMLTACKKETTTVETDSGDTITTSSTTVTAPDLPDSVRLDEARAEAQTRWERAKADVNAAIERGDKKAEEAARKTEAEAKEAWEKLKADTREAREDLKEGYNNTLEKAKID